MKEKRVVVRIWIMFNKGHRSSKLTDLTEMEKFCDGFWVRFGQIYII